MTAMLNELYYIVDDWVGQEYDRSEEAKALMERRSRLTQEIAHRLGVDGEGLLDALSDLNLSLEDIHDKALFRAALSLGAEIARPGRELQSSPAGKRSLHLIGGADAQ